PEPALPAAVDLVLVLAGFAYFQAEDGIRDRNVTGVQTCALPIFNAFEDRWNLSYKFPILLVVTGFAVLAFSSVIGVWSARAIANFGSGTPLPAQMAHHLVTRGPYAFVRNPMA